MMRLLNAIKQRPRHFIIPFICLVVGFYFAYHAIKGERGLFRLFEISAEINDAQKVLAETDIQKEKMQKKVQALSPDSLDVDMLDESGRRLLNVGEKNDYIIYD